MKLSSTGENISEMPARDKENAASAATGEHADNSKAIFCVYTLVVLYALCYQLQSPIEPFLVDKLMNSTGSDSSVVYARVKSLFSITQGFGSLAFGWLLDKYGVRIGLLLNFSACAACYYTLSITDSVEMLYLSKLPGIAMSGFLCAQTAIIKLTPPGEGRLKALGRLTTSYTIGGVVGPFLGGQLGASGDYYVGARMATYGSLICVLLSFFLPSKMDTSKPVEPAKANEKNDTESSTTWTERTRTILSLAWLFLFTKLVTSIANSMARSVQPIVLKNLGVDEATMGTIMGAQFGFGGVANAVLLAPVTRALGGHLSAVVRNCVVVMAFVYIVQALLYSEYTSVLPENGWGRQVPFLFNMMLLSIFQFSLGTTITAETSNIIPRKMQGTLMGMEHSLFAVAYMIGPNVGVHVLNHGSISGLSLACSCIFFVVLTVWLRFARVEVKSTLKEKGE